MYDNKEQVIDFEFTQHGKRLLARGQLKPVFYSFSDDDIVYDSEYMGSPEGPSIAHNRITAETPKTISVPNKHGIETSIRKLVAENQGESEIFIDLFQDESERTYDQISSLGTSDLSNQYAPSWHVTMLAGEISGSDLVISGSAANIRIPQINLRSPLYEVSLVEGLAEEVQEELEFLGVEPGVVSDYKLFGDGTLLEVVPYELLIEVDESNTAFKDSNFDIEIFTVEYQDVTVVSDSSTLTEQKEILRPLYFTEQPQKFGDIYVEEDVDMEFMLQNFKENEVGFYFDLEVDDEIPKEIVCKYVPKDKRRGIYGKYVGCEGPRAIVVGEGLYDSDVDILDDCDD